MFADGDFHVRIARRSQKALADRQRFFFGTQLDLEYLLGVGEL